MDGQNWGVQKGELAIDEAFVMDNSSAPHKIQEHEGIILGTNFGFPLDVAYEKIFIGGKTGSGKSYTSGVFMEELSRHGIQFVCFDALDAHSGLPQLPNVERISPTEEESVNVHKLVYNLQNSNSSLIINMVNLKLETQQEIIGEYCEALLAVDKMGKPIMSFFEECQDFVPQIGRPPSFPPIVRLCKLGRGKGLGATLISQRPAAIHKEALSQVSTYLVHNIINTRDLEALKIQLSFGTDKTTIKNILSSISYASPGEMVCFSPK
jgi:DNA helicase HerA-like ATPase